MRKIRPIRDHFTIPTTVLHLAHTACCKYLLWRGTVLRGEHGIFSFTVPFQRHSLITALHKGKNRYFCNVTQSLGNAPENVNVYFFFVLVHFH